MILQLISTDDANSAISPAALPSPIDHAKTRNTKDAVDGHKSSWHRWSSSSFTNIPPREPRCIFYKISTRCVVSLDSYHEKLSILSQNMDKSKRGLPCTHRSTTGLSDNKNDGNAGKNETVGSLHPAERRRRRALGRMARKERSRAKEEATLMIKSRDVDWKEENITVPCLNLFDSVRAPYISITKLDEVLDSMEMCSVDPTL